MFICIIQQWKNKTCLQIEVITSVKKKKMFLMVNDEANNYYFAVKNFRLKFF